MKEDFPFIPGAQGADYTIFFGPGLVSHAAVFRTHLGFSIWGTGYLGTVTYCTTKQHSVAWPTEGLPTDPSMPCGEGSELELVGRPGEELANRGFLPQQYLLPAQLSYLRGQLLSR